MEKINIKPHTIIITIGPTNCGKSYFCENVLIPFLNGHNIKNKYFSSDSIRRGLLGEDLEKHDKKMNFASKQAFSLLEAGVSAHTTYPINTPVIIVDATHLSKLGRKNIIQIAKDNHYSLVGLLFDYKDRKEFFKYSSETTNKKLIAEMVTTMRESTLKNLERDEFEKIYKINSVDFSTIELAYEETNNYASLTNDKLCVVGDIHGCFDEFLQLLLDDKGLKYDFDANKLIIEDERKYFHHILVGDLIDKGPKIKEVIEFIYENLEFFTIAKGNHENWVYEYLKGHLKQSATNDELIAGYFNTVTILKDDEELRDKFFHIVESSFDFIQTPRAIITHAPCENKYLGKSDKVSIRNQRTIRYPKKRDYETLEDYLNAREEAFKFLLRDADSNYPFHIFGHAPVKDVFVHKNKVGIDSGCVSGGHLSCLLLSDRNNRRGFVKKYKSQQPEKDELLPYFRLKEFQIDLSTLEPETRTRLKYAAENKLNFVSGTMSPCDKLNDDLESLAWGLNYYKEKGVKKVILQPKEMGSRVQVFLHKTNPSLCKAFTRQGFEIKETRLTSSKKISQLLIELQKKYGAIFERLDVEGILFDGELLPWVSMGKGLIEHEFLLPTKALTSEIELLQSTGFEELWAKLQTRTLATEITEETSKHVIKEKQYVAEVTKEVQSLDQMKGDLSKYLDQVNHFGAEQELEFKPFAILKTITKEGVEKNWISSDVSNIDMYEMFGNPYAIVDLEDMNICKTVLAKDTKFDNTIEAFWTYITKDLVMEGVVLKPEFAYVPNVAPYLKCRNKEYLRIVYGMDYDSLKHKAEKLINHKSINRKLSTSIKEWELGKKLLDVPMNEISIENQTWCSLVYQLIEELNNETKLDPRL